MGFCIWLRFSLLSPRRLLGQVSVSSRVRTLRRVRCYPYSSSARRRTSLRFWPSRPGTRCGEATSLTRHCCETRPLMTKRTLVLTKSRLPPCARMLIRVSFVLNRRSSSTSPPAEVPWTYYQTSADRRRQSSRGRGPGGVGRVYS